MSAQEIKITVVKPDTFDEIIERYTEAVFLVVRNKVPVELLDVFIEKLKRSNLNDNSSNIHQKI